MPPSLDLPALQQRRRRREQRRTRTVCLVMCMCHRRPRLQVNSRSSSTSTVVASRAGARPSTHQRTSCPVRPILSSWRPLATGSANLDSWAAPQLRQTALSTSASWIRKPLFDGRVTIWGQSAGAGSVIYHLINRSTTDTGVPLFQQAMGDSPPLLSLLDYDDDFVEGLFSTFAVNAGCNKTTDAATMKCLRSVDQDVLANAGKRTLETAPNSLYPFGPMFDGDFISQRPAQALLTGNFAAVPVLFGSNSDEGANWSAKLPPGGGANTSSASATESTVFNFLAGQYTSLTRETFDDALRGPTEEDDDDTALYPLSDYAGQYSLQGQQMYGEMRYICTGLLVAGAVRRAGKVAYEYHWDNPVLGSTHSDERVAFFETPSPLDEANTNLVGAMREFWTSFVTTGTPESSASASTAEWMPSTENGSPRILLSPEGIRMEEVDPALAARCQFWWESAEELQI